MNGLKNESLSHRLATMPNSGILNIQESMARAITAVEKLEQSRVRTTQHLSTLQDIDQDFLNDATSSITAIARDGFHIFSEILVYQMDRTLFVTTCDYSAVSVGLVNIYCVMMINYT